MAPNVVLRIAWLIESVCFVAQGGDLEPNAASHRKPMQITKEIDCVLLFCGYLTDNLSKIVVDCALVERLLSSTM